MKKENIIALFLTSLATLVFSGCYYDVEEELYPGQVCNVANTTYLADVKPIIDANCLVCHSQSANQGNVVLEGYNNLKGFADSGRLLGAIKHEPGFSAMPQGGAKLSKCKIAAIEQWIIDGSLNN